MCLQSRLISIVFILRIYELYLYGFIYRDALLEAIEDNEDAVSESPPSTECMLESAIHETSKTN